MSEIYIRIKAPIAPDKDGKYSQAQEDSFQELVKGALAEGAEVEYHECEHSNGPCPSWQKVTSGMKLTKAEKVMEL